MADENSSLIGLLRAMFGGGATSMIAAAVGQLAFHSGEASRRRRKFFGPELLWAPPVAVFTAICGEALGSYMGWDRQVMTGVIAVLGYLGPRGVQHAAEVWFAGRKGEKE